MPPTVPTARFWPPYRSWIAYLPGLIGLIGLYGVSRYDFLIFHCLAEAFSIVIGIAVFAIFWNTRHLLEDGVFLVVAIGCLFGGLPDLIYVFAYPGMKVFPGADGNLALQAKTVAQWYVSLSCAGSFLFLRRKINQNAVLFLYSAILGLAVAAIYWRVFPDCFVEGAGFTAFARFGLVVSYSAYLGTLVLLVRNRNSFDANVVKFLSVALLAFFIQDTACAVATELNGFARTIAHLCQVVALFFAYKAFVQVGLRKPYDLMFRSLQQSAKEIRSRNKSLEQRTEQLRALASELTMAEQRERRRLAQVLHDHLQQLLVAAKVQVKRVLDKVADDHVAEPLQGIGNLLDQAIAESRSLTVELSPPVLFDRGLVGGLEWLARWFLNKHQLPVSLDLSADAEPAEEGTRIFLFQAARELLFNTVKHAQAQSARVSLTRLGGAWVRLIVSDDGRGFDPSEINGDSSSGGFGLFSIRERLELVGGRWEVISAPGQGTHTRIEVYDIPPQAAAPAMPRPDVAAGSALREQPSPRIRVMLADDHPVLRKGLGELLREQPQIDVVGMAQDGPEAVELALQTHPDVVLMDVTMPRLTGIEATRQIKDALPAVRVIGLSMHEGEDMAQAMVEAGAAAYLNKSEAAETLVATVLAHGRHVLTRAASGKVRVLLADDHPIVRKWLAEALRERREIDLVGEAGDGQEAVEMARRLYPEIVLMDVSMPRLDGVEATRRILAELPQTRVIGLSMGEDDQAAAMLEVGAVAYLNKSEAAETMVATILAHVPLRSRTA